MTLRTSKIGYGWKQRSMQLSSSKHILQRWKNSQNRWDSKMRS